MALVAGWIVFNKWEYRSDELEFLGDTVRPKWEECAPPENWKQYGLDPVVWVSIDGNSFQRKPTGYDDDAIAKNGGAETFCDVVVSTMHYMFKRDRKTILDFRLAISADGKQVRIGTGLVGSVGDVVFDLRPTKHWAWELEIIERHSRNRARKTVLEFRLTTDGTLVSMQPDGN